MATGALLWSRTVGGVVSSSPLVAEGRVYVGSRNGTFYALSAATGRVVWKRTTWAVWDGAAYRGGTVYVGSDRVPGLGVRRGHGRATMGGRGLGPRSLDAGRHR